MINLDLFPSKRYDILVIDPPWPYYGSTNSMGDAAKHYDLMTMDQISALPVRDWLNARSAVFLWATCPKLDLAMDALDAWGLFYRGVAFTWIKTRKSDGAPIGSQGVRASFTKPTTEFVLVGSTKKKGRPLPIADEGVPQVILAPRRAHSQKPDAVQERIDRLYPELRKAELFARRPFPGWDCYGDELFV